MHNNLTVIICFSVSLSAGNESANYGIVNEAIKINTKTRMEGMDKLVIVVVVSRVSTFSCSNEHQRIQREFA